jgi:hypothetical protein
VTVFKTVQPAPEKHELLYYTSSKLIMEEEKCYGTTGANGLTGESPNSRALNPSRHILGDGFGN